MVQADETVSYLDLIDAIRGGAPSLGVEQYGEVVEGGQRYPLFAFTRFGARTLLLTAGFHGDEPAGSLTLRDHIADVVRLAERWHVGLRIYPCVNPSGFEDGTRYNRTGERPNNDFMRYEIAPEHWIGELRPGQAWLRYSNSNPAAKETRALRSDLERQPVPDAALDIHQDGYLRGDWLYAYTFGDRRLYQPMVTESARHVSVLADTVIDSGYEDHLGLRSDENGLIEFHDGTITDWLWRRGTPLAAALETTTDTPLAACHRVHLIWIEGFVRLAASV